jgi:hypothetical protein
MTASLYVQATVQDFDSWKKHYDGGAEFIREHGVIANKVSRNTDDPNSVMIYHQFANADTLNSFLALMEASKELFEEHGILTMKMWFGEDV